MTRPLLALLGLVTFVEARWAAARELPAVDERVLRAGAGLVEPPVLGIGMLNGRPACAFSGSNRAASNNAWDTGRTSFIGAISRGGRSFP